MFVISEIIDIIAMTLFLGWLFSDMIRRPMEKTDVVDFYRQNFQKIKWRDIQFAALVIAPGIILHELAHKFTAIAFGAEAQFFAFYRVKQTLFMGVLAAVMKLMNTGFIFIVPGFVMHTPTSRIASVFIAFAGPAVHLILWLGSMFFLKRKIPSKYVYVLHLTKQINMFLFIFNMLPIPGFDGWHIYSSLLSYVI